MWFTRASIGNPVMAVMVMLAFIVLGLFSYQRLKVDQFPEIDFPTVVVQVDYPGAAPEIVESEVTKRVEESINTLAGISQLFSRSYEGSSVVIVQFNLDVNGRKAADDVREKMSIIKAAFRDEVKEPRVSRFDPASRPVLSVALTSPDQSQSVQQLTTYADQVLKKRLENVRGVGSVSRVGGVKREINIYLKPQAMEAFGIGVEAITAAVRSENQDLPAGALRSREAERIVQIEGRLKRPEDLKQIIVARRGAATVGATGSTGAGSATQAVRLGQVADVVDGPEELETLALYNGQRTLALEVLKSQGENTIEVVDGLRKVVATLQPQLPPGMALEVVRDNSRPIRVSVANVKRTLLEGALLTIAIVFLFLNSWRSTVITGLTLPIALIGTFIFMDMFGFSINMITLMAMSLCVGLLIDDAIVVRENIVRHVQMGKSAHDAALAGTQEIGLAVLATTLSIVAVFLPVGFMGGIIGKFFHEFGITIVSAVLISMFVSFTLDPMLSSVWHDPAAHGGTPDGRERGNSLYDRTLGRVTGAVDRFSHWLGDVYQVILAWSLRHRLATVGVALASLAASVGLAMLLGTEFVPKADFGETSVNFQTPVGSSIEVTEARARQVEAIIREFPEVRYTVATLNTGNALGKNNASVYVRMVERKERKLTIDEMSVPLRERLARVPGITVTHIGLLDPVGGGKPLQFSIQGNDLGELRRLSKALQERLRSVPGLVDVDSSLKDDRPNVSVVVDRDAAADAGLSVGAISTALRALVAGQTLGNWRAADDQNYDVKVRLAPSARDNPADIERLSLTIGGNGNNADGSARTVRLGQVARLQSTASPSQINRRDLNREVDVTANRSGRSAGEVAADLKQILADTAFPPGYTYRFGGSTKDMQESFAYALSALGLGVIFIYMILASQFRSYLQPLALMSSLPLTLIGVVLALLVFRSTLNMFSVIGVVMLMGLVTKNAILLVDFTIRSRADGMGREQALLHAAKVRLRPILMTTLAMIFGMLPLALAISEGSEQRAPMGQAVIGGVITSSLLTLVVVPVIYCWLDDLAAWAGRRRLRPVSPA